MSAVDLPTGIRVLLTHALPLAPTPLAIAYSLRQQLTPTLDIKEPFAQLLETLWCDDRCKVAITSSGRYQLRHTGACFIGRSAAATTAAPS